jgi:hypothetical protein
VCKTVIHFLAEEDIIHLPGQNHNGERIPDESQKSDNVEEDACTRERT